LKRSSILWFENSESLFPKAFSFTESHERHAGDKPRRPIHVATESRTEIIESLAGESLFRFALKPSSLMFRIENQQASVIASATKRCLFIKSGAAEVILPPKRD
jgi:hypothetical protein